jgi:hypothetical protein
MRHNPNMTQKRVDRKSLKTNVVDPDQESIVCLDSDQDSMVSLDPYPDQGGQK